MENNSRDPDYVKPSEAFAELAAGLSPETIQRLKAMHDEGMAEILAPHKSNEPCPICGEPLFWNYRGNVWCERTDCSWEEE